VIRSDRVRRLAPYVKDLSDHVNLMQREYGMKFLSMVSARLQEPSTYAGLSAVCVAVSSALSQAGTARYLALFGAVATGVGAIARAEHNSSLSDAMDQAVQLVPVLTNTVRSAEEAASTMGTLHDGKVAASK
jgi:hypothetical protein